MPISARLFPHANRFPMASVPPDRGRHHSAHTTHPARDVERLAVPEITSSAVPSPKFSAIRQSEPETAKFLTPLIRQKMRSEFGREQLLFEDFPKNHNLILIGQPS